MVELVVVDFLCIRLDFLVEVVVEGYWWWSLWLWVSRFAVGVDGGGL